MRGNADIAKSFNQKLRDEGVFKSDGKWYPSIPLSEEDLQMTDAAIATAAAHAAG